MQVISLSIDQISTRPAATRYCAESCEHTAGAHPAAMSKPVLSSRLMGLKFMQRRAEKEKKAEAAEAAEERDAEVGSS